jgi:hypothetical protein
MCVLKNLYRDPYCTYGSTRQWVQYCTHFCVIIFYFRSNDRLSATSIITIDVANIKSATSIATVDVADRRIEKVSLLFFCWFFLLNLNSTVTLPLCFDHAHASNREESHRIERNQNKQASKRERESKK